MDSGWYAQEMPPLAVEASQPGKPPAQSVPGKGVTGSLLPTLLLAAILLAGAGLRLYRIDWDGGTLPHPDERSTVAFYAPTIRLPADLSAALDPRRSTLNPFWDVAAQQRRSYTYGHFPLYLLVLTAELVHPLAPVVQGLGLPAAVVTVFDQARSPVGYAYVGRFLMALSDTASIFLVFLLGRRLYGRWAGLLAAAFSAFTVLQIQLAHFFAVDPISTTFTLLALYGSIRMADRGSRAAAILTGVGIGLAVASKFSALPIIAAPLVATLLAARRPAADRPAPVGRLWGNLLIAGGIALAAFAITSPFVFLDFQDFWQAVVKEQGDMVTGVADLPFTRQYRGTPAYLYFLEQQLWWGMGLPLGLLAYAGLAWVLVRAVRLKLSAGEWIVLSWVILYFGPTGLFLAKFMRYMVPVVPLFVLFGAGLVARAKGQMANGKWQMAAVVSFGRYAAAAVALLGAIVWSLAFVNGVYGREHPWITASRWVYANVPYGACIAGEHWEEGFPRSWDEPGMSPDAHAYRQPLLPMYEEDTRQKFETIRDTLQNCDYLVLASNRLWRTIPKLPQRYPMSTRYYQDLFAGELGYEQVYTTSSPPRLGPLVIDDQSADESFTVYDHPHPIIFKRVRQLSDAEWEALLGKAWQNAIPGYVGGPTLLMQLRGMTPGAAELPGSSPLPQANRKSLLLDRPVDQLPVVDDFHWNTLANQSPLAAIAIWWLAVQIIGWLAWPLARRVLGTLADQGCFLAKSLGWLLVSYGVWLSASLRLFPNTQRTALGMVVILAGTAVWLAWRAVRRDDARSPRLAGRQLRLILIEEVIFGLAFLYFVGLRLLNPDLWQPWNGGEKMLEIGFLNAIVKSAYLPPYDPYFAGGIINYYYYGLFLVGVLIKLTGIQPTIAFNLAVPTLAALTAGNVFCLAFNLALRRPSQRQAAEEPAGQGAPAPAPPVQAGPYGWRPLIVGVLAVVLVVFVGNLAGFTQLVHMLEAIGGSTFHIGVPWLGEAVRALAGVQRIVWEGVKLPSYNYWDPTRAIPNTINEFPYFSFIFADLHPHMIGIPFTVLFLALVYALCQPPGTSDPGRSRLRSGLRWLVVPVCLGALAVINTWDLPTYLGLATFSFWLSRYRQPAVTFEGADPPAFAPAQPIPAPAGLARPVPRLGRLTASLLKAAAFGGLTLALSYLLYLPFFANYQPLDVGLGLVQDKTDLGQFLSIWGMALAVVISYLLTTLVHPQTRLAGLRTASLFLRRWNVAPHLASLRSSLVGAAGQSHDGAAWAGVLLVLGITAGLWLAGYHVPGLLLPLVCLSLAFLLRGEPSAGPTFVGLLVFTGLALLLGVEIFHLRDFLGGSPYYRMNTLFKFYIQVWVMLGIAGAFLLVTLWERAAAWRRAWLSLAWQGGMSLVMMAVLVYPVLGTPSRLHDRFAQPPPIGTLDGMAYMTTGKLMWPQDNVIDLWYDYQAIRWLQANVKGTPVVAEAKIGYYREGGMRVSSYTGLPMPLGGLHQSEQRWPDQVGQRDGLYMEFWNTGDPERAWQLIQALDISYIYLGQLEQTLHNPRLTSTLMQSGVTYFAPGGLRKFDTLRAQGRLELVYQNERTRIYQVVRK